MNLFEEVRKKLNKNVPLVRDLYYYGQMIQRYGPKNFSFSTTRDTLNKFILTGIPRSGTSLLSTLLSQQDGYWCCNELSEAYNVRTLEAFFSTVITFYENNNLLPNKAYSDGNLANNTLFHSENEPPKEVEVKELEYKDNLQALGSKITGPYLVRLQGLLSNYKCIVLIRNPVFVIGSWAGMDPSPVIQWRGNNRGPLLNEDAFLENACKLYNHFLAKIRAEIGNENLNLIFYKNLVDEPSETIQKIKRDIGIETKVTTEKSLKNNNVKSRYCLLNKTENCDHIKEECLDNYKRLIEMS